MHSLSRMKSLLSSHLLSPPLSLPISPSPSRTHFLALPRISEWNQPNPISFLPKPAISARRACSSAQIDGGKKLPPFGEIHVIVGPMFAGKTTALLRRIQSESSIGRKYAVIKSNKDDRYGLDSVVTHDGVKMPCWALSKLSIFRATIGDKAYEEIDLYNKCKKGFNLYGCVVSVLPFTYYDGKTVFVAGLDGDYLRRRFGSVTEIIPLADSVTKLTARCEVCGSRAFFTLRKTTDTQTEVIGGADFYMPVCRQHYVDGQVAVETARLVLESHKAQHLEAASSTC